MTHVRNDQAALLLDHSQNLNAFAPELPGGIPESISDDIHFKKFETQNPRWTKINLPFQVPKC